MTREVPVIELKRLMLRTRDVAAFARPCGRLLRHCRRAGAWRDVTRTEVVP
jgi:hypothetical protein